MRKNILAAGVTLLALALLFGVSYPDGLLFSMPISILNIILGLVTRTPPGLEIQPESANVRLVIDRAVVRASIYQLVFLNSKLILKRLSSVTVTVILAPRAIPDVTQEKESGCWRIASSGNSRLRNKSEGLRLRRKAMNRPSIPVATVATAPAANTLLGSMNSAPRPSTDST